MCDITEEKFAKQLLPFYINLNEYMIEFIIPDTIAFYLANAYNRNCLSNWALINHINSAKDIFNIICDIDTLIPKIELILKIKYNLKIVKVNPLKMKKYS